MRFFTYTSALFCLISSGLFAQETPIQNGTVNQCGGFIVDTGLSAGNYGNNENFTMTICPEAPEAMVSLSWLIFDLGAGDFMTIHDGPNTSAPTIGTFSGGQLQSVNTIPSAANTSGCLTLVFTSDGSVTGNFGAQVICGTPCDVPIAVVTTAENQEPLLVCVDETITFSGANSVVANGFTVATWEWHMGDGTVIPQGPTVTHSYSTPGAYKVQLYIEDTNGCNNFNLTDFYVYVSTQPTFTGISPNQLICVDQQATLTGAIQPTTWTAIPEANFGGALFIPDNQTQCFSSTITFTGFNPGQTITQVSDLINFFINFEHSFMGDLVISFICPNGQTLIVHQQGGGGTYLGVPVDNDGDLTPGVGFDYYWSPTATNGTWSQNAGGTLPSGTYASVQPFSNLIGCPLNGGWTIQICDLWASDNGYIFDWAVNFNPDLFPDLVEFTPQFDPGPAGTFWTGPGIVSTSADGNTITVSHNTPGSYVYTFHGIDNHGCEYTQDVTVQVEPRPVVEVTTVGSPCTDVATILATVTNPNNLLSPYSYSWNPAGQVNNPNSAQTQTAPLTTNTTFIVTVNPTNNPGCTSTGQITIFVEEVPPLTGVLPNQSSPCPGTEINLNLTVTGGNPAYSFSWSTGENTEDITVAPEETTTYTVTIIDQCNQIQQSMTVTVAQPGTEIFAEDIEACALFPTALSTLTGGTGNYYFNASNDLLFDLQMMTVYGNVPGVFTVIITDDCMASGTFEFTVNQCDVILPNIFSPNGDGINDILYFDGLEFLPKSILKVWNRWGQIVHESDNYQNDWKGDDLSEGVYYYMLQLPEPYGNQYFNSLQLVRK
jgi:gliding motility-associated-like protein